MWNERENAIEWLDGQMTATVTLCSQKLRNKVMRLAEQFPEEVEIRVKPEDNNGTLVAHIPRKWVKISPPPKREMTEEQREAARVRLKSWAAAREAIEEVEQTNRL